MRAWPGQTRPEDFLARHPPPLLLDEVQYAPRFFRRIKTYVDQHRGESGLFLLTGSQNFLLMDALADSLAGRVAVVPLLGLSAEEWSRVPSLSRDRGVSDFVWRGGYPALWADGDHPPARDRWYQSYLATYLERDVRGLSRVGSLRDFERFLRACAARTGQPLNVSKLGRDVGISHTTASKWLSVLQASNQIFLLEPYYRSLGKRLVKSPKLYFTDTGLASFLMSFSSAQAAWSSAQAGALWETHVVGQWLRHRDWKEPSLGLWFYRDPQGREVDLVIERDQRLHGVECKLTERPSARDLRGLRALSSSTATRSRAAPSRAPPRTSSRSNPVSKPAPASPLGHWRRERVTLSGLGSRAAARGRPPDGLAETGEGRSEITRTARGEGGHHTAGLEARS